jgi:alpha,alpha-trehalase
VLVLRIEDGDWLRPDGVEMLDYRQELGLCDGLLLRRLRFRDGQGRTTRWEERRFVSMQDRHVAGLAVTVTPEDWSGRLTVRTALDGTVVNAGVARYRDLEGRHLETIRTAQPGADVIFLQSRMAQSRREIALAARTRFYLDGAEVDVARRTEALPDLIAQETTLEVAAGRALVIEKLVALYTSGDPRDRRSRPRSAEQGRRARRLRRAGR